MTTLLPVLAWWPPGGPTGSLLSWTQVEAADSTQVYLPQCADPAVPPLGDGSSLTISHSRALAS